MGIVRPLFLTVILTLASGLLATLPQMASAASTSCNKKQIAQARDVLRDMAPLGTALSRKNYIEYSFRPIYDAMLPFQRKIAIEWYVHAHACVHGVVREIRFYQNGKMVGKSDEDLNIELHY